MYEVFQHSKRGFAVIVNIKQGRHGSEKDVDMMKTLFTELKYEVVVFEDKTREVCIIVSSIWFVMEFARDK